MSIENEVFARSGAKCELCGAEDGLAVFTVPPKTVAVTDECALLCETCRVQIEDYEKIDVHHWRCLNDSMWSQIPGVQVLVWRVLNRLRGEGWPQDLLDMLFLEDDVLAWAKETEDDEAGESTIKHIDSNGAILETGDTVTLIKDLNVKGGGFTAKRGTVVRNISLDANNEEHIEGRVSGQRIVILTKFVKKSN